MPGPANLAVSFDPVEIDITLAGLTATVPAHPASVWLPILASDQTDALEIIPGLLDTTGQAEVDLLIFEGHLEPEELKQVIYDLITEASGHPWWWTLNLLSTLRGPNGTQVLGEMAKFNATKMSLAAWVNALYAMLVRHRDQKDRIRIDAELEMPPPGVELEISEADQQATEAAFFSMMRQANG